LHKRFIYLNSLDKQIFKIALPLVFSNLSVPLVGFVDNTVLGHLDSPIYLASAGLGAIIMSYIIFSFGFIKSITTGYISQQDHLSTDKAVRTIYQILIISLFISLFLILSKSFLIDHLLYFLGNPGQINQNASVYLDIRFWSIPAIFIRDIFVGYLIGIKKTSVAMKILILINMLNIILDYFFVYILSMNIEGVAYASLISESTIFIFILHFVTKDKIFLNKVIFLSSIRELSTIKNKLIVNGNMFIRSVILMTCFAHFMSLSASFGEVVLAANTILLNFFFIFSYGIDAFAHATEVMIGNSVGQQDINKYDMTIVSSFKYILSILFLFLSIFFIFSTDIISMVTSHQEVIYSAQQSIIYLFLIVTMGSIAFCIDGILIGGLQHIRIRNIMIYSGVIYFFFLVTLLPSEPYSIWYPFLVFFMSRSILLFLSLSQIRGSLFR
tara:strand:+ start:185 stop:1507 length:1323 start_codon:yes stop_codon:yes gene_type:complete